MSPRQTFDPNSYVSVAERLEKFRSQHPDGVIVTELHNDGLVYVVATVSAQGGSATGMKAVPTQGDNPIEKAETGAIGRALVNFGYSAKRTARRPSPAGGERSPSSPPAPSSRSSSDGEGSSGTASSCPHGAPTKARCVLCKREAS